ncbi:hypothetical protein CYMTET_37928 [Cymbomonas tetramitiformis]|uniref:SWIM-type domain-containing protein n=1 Tax=Cymbomonas tetramitiformis TaxID=36881 RepID=A0AAE0CEI7_9CHLO|nr:hypothetical protein CYMTET_37928 [Cymbomonas tetramitiformis]
MTPIAVMSEVQPPRTRPSKASKDLECPSGAWENLATAASREDAIAYKDSLEYSFVYKHGAPRQGDLSEFTNAHLLPPSKEDALALDKDELIVLPDGVFSLEDGMGFVFSSIGLLENVVRAKAAWGSSMPSETDGTYKIVYNGWPCLVYVTHTLKYNKERNCIQHSFVPFAFMMAKSESSAAHAAMFRSTNAAVKLLFDIEFKPGNGNSDRATEIRKAYEDVYACNWTTCWPHIARKPFAEFRAYMRDNSDDFQHAVHGYLVLLHMCRNQFLFDALAQLVVWAWEQKDEKKLAVYVSKEYLSAPHNKWFYIASGIPGSHRTHVPVDKRLSVEKFCERYLSLHKVWFDPNFELEEGVQPGLWRCDCKGFFHSVVCSHVLKVRSLKNGAPHADDSVGVLQARKLFEENVAKVAAVYANGRHRQSAKAVRELSLGGKDQFFEAAKDSEKLSKIVVVLKNEFRSAGLDLSSFDFDDLTKAAIPKVDELLYDTLAYIVKTDSAAEHFLLDTDSVSDRDGRRALLDLIKGCVPPGRLVRDNRSEDLTPTEMSRKLFELLDPDFNAAGPALPGPLRSDTDERVLEVLGMLTTMLEKIEAAIKMQKAGGTIGVPFSSAIAAAERVKVAADDGSEAFAAPARSGVLSELEAFTGQVRVMEERVGVHLSQVSLVGGEDVLEHRAPVGAPSANAVASDVPRQVVPHGGGIGSASGGDMPAAGAQSAAIPPHEYWQPEGLYWSPHTPWHAVWHPGPSYPQVVVPFPGPWWEGVPPSPPYSPPPSAHEPEEVEQPALNGDWQSTGGGVYIDASYGVDLTAPLHRVGNNNTADIFTQPLPPQAVFYDNPSYYGRELQSEVSDTDSGYGSAMDEVD